MLLGSDSARTLAGCQMKTPTWYAPYRGLAVYFGRRYPSWSGIIPTVKDWAAMPFSRGVQTASRSTVIIAYLALSGCASSQPVIQVERISVPVYLPVPSTLVAPVSAIFPSGVTYGQALGIQQAAIQTCNANLNAISTLKAPPKQ